MNDTQRILATWAGINSALYLTGVFAAAMVWGHPVPACLAIATAGVCFVSYSVQLAGACRALCAALTCASAAVGIAAGTSLLVEVFP